MQSKRSFFNKTVFKKNMTRFAPVWILYTLLLLVVLAVAYMNDRSPMQCYTFATQFFNLKDVFTFFNTVYGLVVAQLLFGDLYNSRMAGALHAFPLRRESWFVTNVVSGLLFSLIPTLVMALVALPMLANSIFVGAWKLPFLTMLVANLGFICCFGLAVFSAMCVGNRFTMIAGYGLLHGGAQIGFWAVNVLYTPMLYGVITPTRLSVALTPIYHMTRNLYEYTRSDELSKLLTMGNNQWSDLTAEFTLTGEWWRLWVIAAVGILLLAAALMLYRKRNLECAGDAVAFPFLRPVFQVLCTLFIVVGSWYFLRDMIGIDTPVALKYGLLALAMVVGWFTGKMLVERSTRVFGKRNWYGLGILAAVMALSLVCTHFDILGIEERLPDPDKVEKVTLGTSYMLDYPLTDKADIEKVLRLHSLALEERVERDGLYVRGYDGTFVEVVDSNDERYDKTQEKPDLAQAVNIHIYYTMKNGSTMERRYNIWTEKEAGDIARELLSRWEIVSEDRTLLDDGTIVNGAEYAVQNILYFAVCNDQVLKEEPDLQKAAMSFLKAVKADCEAGNMASDRRFHLGFFQSREPQTEWDGTEYYQKRDGLYVALGGKNIGWNVYVYPGCENTVRWLQEHGLLDDWEIVEDTAAEWESLRESTNSLG